MPADIKQKLEDINNDLLRIPQLKAVQDAINVPIGLVIVGLLTLSVILVGFASSFSNFIVTIIAVVYPVWKSCEAVETTETLEDDKQWLTYWSIFGLFNFIDNLGASVLSYIPFYYLIKLLILIWLQNPMTNGATIVYNKYVRPVQRKHANVIEDIAEAIESFINPKSEPPSQDKSGKKLI